MPAMQQSPTTPKTTPKGAATAGAPMGSKKTPKKSTPTPPAPRSEQLENLPKGAQEQPHTPVPGESEGEDYNEAIEADVKPEAPVPGKSAGKEAVKPDPKEAIKPDDKPEAPKLDEAIDLGDNENQEGGDEEDTETNVEAPSEAENLEAPEAGNVEAPSEAENLDAPSELENAEAPSELENAEAPSELDNAEAPDELENVEAPDEAENVDEQVGEEQIGEEQVGEEGLEEQLGEDGVEQQLGEDDLEELPAEPLDFSILEGKKVNKAGLIVDDDGNPVGRLIEGEAKKLSGKAIDAEGNIWNDSGKIIGKAEPIPIEDREPVSTAPFEDFPDAVVDASGKILFEGKKIGIVTEGNPKELAGKKVDPDGDILDRHGNVIGKSIREDDEEPEPEPEEEPEKLDYSALVGLRVNKAGNIVTESGKLVGRVVEGSLKSLIGKTVDEEGQIHNDVGKVIGRAEPIPENEKEDHVEAPFEDFPGAIVEKSGDVVYEGKVIGKVIEGDAKKLAGKTVDPEGDIVDKNGTVVGKAERWDEEEVPEVDMSILAGKRVNKAGNVVDTSGVIYGKLIEGDVKALAGRMCDKQGFVRNEAGDVIGKAELVPEGDREGLKTGPFSDFENCTVTKDGKVTCEQGIVGILVEGDPKKLFGKAVDEDGDVLDANGTVVGKAERWEEEEVQKNVHPLSGLKVNKNGEVYDSNGELAGKLTEGVIGRCAGQTIDDDGDVVDQKGTSIGHVTLIGDIEEEPEPEPEETEEEKEKRLQAEEDKKLAIQMANCISTTLDQIKPVLKNITEAIDKAERAPKDELDEEKVVAEVKPLIEEGSRILTEANGVIRGLDPDGRIAANAKHKTAAREATPEEYRLADLLKELTGNVTQTIDNAKKKIADMPHAKKELNPLWALLSEPLFQILAAVGLLLSGVLGLVGQLLNGLGLGGLVNGILGGLGITRVLDGLGLGKILAPITGSKKK